MMNTLVKTSLNLSSTWGAQEQMIYETLFSEIMKPAVNIGLLSHDIYFFVLNNIWYFFKFTIYFSIVERLLNETNLKVFMYNGQLDFIVSTPGN